VEKNRSATRGAAGAAPRRTAGDRRHSPSRERLLREIESRGSASAAELAAATGLHENTVRGHLDRLRADGHIRREQDPPIGRGRPSHRWRAVDPGAVSPYAGLAAALADALVGAGAAARGLARAAGVAWGARLAAEQPAGADPRGLLVDLMREQGFGPERVGDALHLRRCPLIAAAARRTEVVCAVHEGMVEGIVRSHDRDAGAALEPFAAAGGACVLRLQAAS